MEVIRRTFYGSKSDNTCAYCYKHHLSLTPRQMKTRECLKRNCPALCKCEHHIWSQKAASKEKRKSRKQRLEEQYQAIVNKEVVDGVPT